MDFDWEERIGMEMEMETGGAGTPETGEKGLADVSEHVGRWMDLDWTQGQGVDRSGPRTPNGKISLHPTTRNLNLSKKPKF
jgi:hypothetical protein